VKIYIHFVVYVCQVNKQRKAYSFLFVNFQELQTFDQVQKLVVNDCEMSSTKKLKNIIHLKYHFKIMTNIYYAGHIKQCGKQCGLHM